MKNRYLKITIEDGKQHLYEPIENCKNWGKLSMMGLAETGVKTILPGTAELRTEQNVKIPIIYPRDRETLGDLIDIIGEETDQTYTLEIVELTAQEYGGLPEFYGW